MNDLPWVAGLTAIWNEEASHQGKPERFARGALHADKVPVVVVSHRHEDASEPIGYADVWDNSHGLWFQFRPDPLNWLARATVNGLLEPERRGHGPGRLHVSPYFTILACREIQGVTEYQDAKLLHIGLLMPTVAPTYLGNYARLFEAPLQVPGIRFPRKRPHTPTPTAVHAGRHADRASTRDELRRQFLRDGTFA